MERLKGVGFAPSNGGDGHHQGMGHGADGFLPQLQRRPHIRGGGEATGDRRPRRPDRPLGTKGAPGAKLQQHGFGAGYIPQAGGAGGNQGLVIEGIEQIGFDNLGLPQGRFDAEQRLIGKHGRAFGDGPDIAGKPRPGEQVPKTRWGLVENAGALERVEVAIAKVKILQKL